MNIFTYLRQFRLFDYAIIDLSLTFFGVYLLGPWLSKFFKRFGLKIPRASWLFWALPIGIVIHLIFGVATPMTAQFIDPSSHIMMKVFIAGLIALGFRGVKQI